MTIPEILVLGDNHGQFDHVIWGHRVQSQMPSSCLVTSRGSSRSRSSWRPSSVGRSSDSLDYCRMDLTRLQSLCRQIFPGSRTLPVASCDRAASTRPLLSQRKRAAVMKIARVGPAPSVLGRAISRRSLDHAVLRRGSACSSRYLRRKATEIFRDWPVRLPSKVASGFRSPSRRQHHRQLLGCLRRWQHS